MSEESTRIVRVRRGEREVQHLGGRLHNVSARSRGGVVTDRIVKYIANRAAKNISSLESQTMVPTLTMLGRS